MVEQYVFCIGAQKSGSSSLSTYVGNKHEFSMPDSKEANFFDIQEEFRRGEEYWLQKYYKGSVKKLFNSNPNITTNPLILRRFLEWAQDKNVSVLILLRDPLQRAISHYWMSYNRGYESRGLNFALRSESLPKHRHRRGNYYTKELGHFESNHLNYFLRSNYKWIIDMVFDYLPPENVHIIKYESMIADWNRFDKWFCELFDLPPNSQLINVHSNAAIENRFNFIQELLSRDTLLKTILKKIIPNSSLWKKRIQKINSRPRGKLELSIEDDTLKKYKPLINYYDQIEFSFL